MNRERIKRIEAKLAPTRHTCVFIEELGNPRPTIYCDAKTQKIPASECPQVAGGLCPYSARFVHAHAQRIDSQGNVILRGYDEPISNEVTE